MLLRLRAVARREHRSEARLTALRQQRLARLFHIIVDQQTFKFGRARRKTAVVHRVPGVDQRGQAVVLPVMAPAAQADGERDHQGRGQHAERDLDPWFDSDSLRRKLLAAHSLALLPAPRDPILSYVRRKEQAGSSILRKIKVFQRRPASLGSPLMHSRLSPSACVEKSLGWSARGLAQLVSWCFCHGRAVTKTN